jgi:hypothetical protein
MATNHGALTPPATSLAASKSFSRSVKATKAHGMTLAGCASFNSGILLAAATMDRALKWSMAEERMNKSYWGEVREKEMSWGILKVENRSLFGILPFHNMNDDVSMGRTEWEKTESKRAQGQAGWPWSVDSRPHFAPKSFGIFPKIPL